ncbi:MAG: hypothetical protein HYX28_11375, partial [Candidatus Koribacter versatilis]|nr:hypothetical protein [Candidatus Koribacter versatilis]
LAGGNVFTGGKQTLAPGTAAAASLNIDSGVAPTVPAAGDVWNESGDLKVRTDGSTTRTLAYTDSAISGTAATSTKLAANGSNCAAGEAALGVDEFGAAEGCYNVATQTELDAEATTRAADDAGTLASAKTYADAGDVTTLASAKTYADAGDAATLASAKTYADAGDATTLASAKTYADAGDATTLASAKTYADAGDAATLASAKTYADAGDAATLASAKTYADAGDAATLASANGYTDTTVGTEATARAAGDAANAAAISTEATTRAADDATETAARIAADALNAKLAGGNVFTGGKQTLAPGTAAAASLNIDSGVAPTVPAAGDIWNESGDLKVRTDGSTTRTLAYTDSPISGNAATATKLAADGSNCVSGFATGVDEFGAAQGCSTDGSALTSLNASNLSSGTVPAGRLSGSYGIDISGNAATATSATSATNFSGSLSGDVTGTQGATVVSSVGGSTAANVNTATVAANAATSANTASTIVARDAGGNFSAGTITASLTGNVTGNISGNAATATLAADSSLLGGSAPAAYEKVANKNAASGYAGLDATSRIAKAQAPSTTVYTDQSNTYSAGVQDFSAAANTLPIRAVAVLPATCTAEKEMVILTGGAQYQQTFLCDTAGTGWDKVGAGPGTGSVTSVATGSGLTGGPITTSGTISIAAAGVTNAMLANSSITVSAGTGISVSGSPVSLGGTVTVTNAGVTSLAGTANQITASAATGAVTLSFPAAGVTLPGKTTLTASTTSAASLNVPSGAAPTTPAAGDVWNQGGSFRLNTGTATEAVATTPSLAATSVSVAGLAINGNRCAADISTGSVANANTGDAVMLIYPAGWSGINTQNLGAIAWVDSANTVVVRVCNWSNVAKTIPAGTNLSFRVIHF